LRWVWRRTDAHDTGVELAFGVLGAPIALALAFLATRLPDTWLPACRLRHALGIPCPTCGTLRCLRLLSEGRLGQAWVCQPLATVFALAAGAFSVYAWTVVLLRLPRLRLEGVSRRFRVRAAALLLIAVLANWLYLLWSGR
jgi:hypothetical protein